MLDDGDDLADLFGAADNARDDDVLEPTEDEWAIAFEADSGSAGYAASRSSAAGRPSDGAEGGQSSSSREFPSSPSRYSLSAAAGQMALKGMSSSGPSEGLPYAPHAASGSGVQESKSPDFGLGIAAGSKSIASAPKGGMVVELESSDEEDEEEEEGTEAGTESKGRSSPHVSALPGGRSAVSRSAADGGPGSAYRQGLSSPTLRRGPSVAKATLLPGNHRSSSASASSPPAAAEFDYEIGTQPPFGASQAASLGEQQHEASSKALYQRASSGEISTPVPRLPGVDDIQPSQRSGSLGGASQGTRATEQRRSRAQSESSDELVVVAATGDADTGGADGPSAAHASVATAASGAGIVGAGPKGTALPSMPPARVSLQALPALPPATAPSSSSAAEQKPRSGAEVVVVPCVAVLEMTSTLKYRGSRFALGVRLAQLRSWPPATGSSASSSSSSSSSASDSSELVTLDATIGHDFLQDRLGCTPGQLVEHLGRGKSKPADKRQREWQKATKKRWKRAVLQLGEEVEQFVGSVTMRPAWDGELAEYAGQSASPGETVPSQYSSEMSHVEGRSDAKRAGQGLNATSWIVSGMAAEADSGQLPGEVASLLRALESYGPA